MNFGNVDKIKERLLGMKAVEKKFINEKQLTQCLNTIELFETHKTLIQVLLEKGFMTQNQIKRLLKIIDDEEKGWGEPPKESKDKVSLFGMLAVEKTLISNSQLEKALEEQSLYYERGVKVQVGQILSRRGMITITQIGNILEEQMNKTFYCKKCQISITVHGAKNEIHQCTHCGVDLDEVKSKKKAKKQKAPELEEMKLDVLEI